MSGNMALPCCWQMLSFWVLHVEGAKADSENKQQIQ